MQRWRKAIAGFVWAVGSGVGFAHALQPVTTTLVVHRVVTQVGGRSTLAPASTAKPGDVLEYVAKFHNQGDTVVHGLIATLPLPVGTEFVPGSTHPTASLASVDGATFAPMPLQRIVKRPDGTSHAVLVPAREYRFLRWAPTNLAAHGELSVSARVIIAATRKRSP